MVVVLKLSDFIEFASGLTGLDPRSMYELLLDVVRNAKPVVLRNGYIISFNPDSGEITVSRRGVIVAVYRRTPRPR